MTRRAETEPALVPRGRTAASPLSRVLGNAATTGRLPPPHPPRRPHPRLTFPSLQVASGSLVAVLGQLRWRVSDEGRALCEGLRGRLERGGRPHLPRRGQEAHRHPTVQPAALRTVERRPLGTREF